MSQNLKYRITDTSFFLSSLDEIEITTKFPLLLKDFSELPHKKLVKKRSNKLHRNYKELLKFINKNFFENYFNYISLLIHHKGENSVGQHELNSSIYTKKLTHTKNFFTLFNAVAKSRNQSFGQNDLRGFDFNLIGTFIGRAFSTHKFNILIIFSKQDFLPQSLSILNKINESEETINHLLSINIQSIELSERITILNEASSKITTPLKSNIEISKELYSNLVIRNNDISSFNIKLENQLKNLEIIHQEKIKLLGDLFNTLRHELSNPLFGLEMSFTILRDKYQDESLKKLVLEVEKAVKRAGNIINNTSALYKSSITFEKCNPELLLNDVIKLSKSETKGIQIVINNELKNEKEFNLSKTWIHQILFNLIINSSQALNLFHSNSPQITIDIYSESDSLIFTISDNGPGISLKNQGQVFKPFFTTKHKGNGLGLSLSQNLAQKMNGSLEYQNLKPFGSKFTLRVPAI